jgi:5-methyltetrahydrofolate--homocysteine methyltransferase
VCVDAVRASDLLLGHDAWGASWIAVHRARQAAQREATPAA